jgi:hypothetical protein
MTVSESSGDRRPAWPADYYSLPTPERVLPSWTIFGCGGAASLVLVLIFAGALLLTGERFAAFIDFTIGMSLGEMRAQFAADVTEERKKSLEAEIEVMRTNLREGRIGVPALKPFLESLRAASSDRKVTAQEAAQLEDVARNTNRRKRR